MSAIGPYRLARWLWLRHVPFVPRLLKLGIFLLFNSSVPYQARIGRGTQLGYGGIGVVIHHNAVVGDGVMIGPNVTIGGRSGIVGVPRIGSHVYIGAGARILGDIDVGDHAVIGANAVVIHSVPPYGVVAGVPAKLLRVAQPGATPEPELETAS